MKDPRQATIPVYIRFGELPKDENSAVHASDAIIRNEGGVSVWRAIEDQGKYWPLMPDNPNDNTIADYFHMLTNLYGCGEGPVYLVIGDEIGIEGASREPLLQNVKIIEDISNYYVCGSNNAKNKKKEKESIVKETLKELESLELLSTAQIKKYKEYKNKAKEVENATDQCTETN